jgi:thioredoxin reductase (NADPH)
MAHLVSADLSKSRPIELNSSAARKPSSTRTLIIASGASARWLGLASANRR